jgi:hypothetical protein
MTIQMTTDHTTQGGSAGVLAQVRTVFNAGRTRSVAWREEQLRAIERMCEEREAEISAALTKDLGRSTFEAWLGATGGAPAAIPLDRAAVAAIGGSPAARRAALREHIADLLPGWIASGDGYARHLHAQVAAEAVIDALADTR